MAELDVILLPADLHAVDVVGTNERRRHPVGLEQPGVGVAPAPMLTLEDAPHGVVRVGLHRTIECLVDAVLLRAYDGLLRLQHRVEQRIVGFRPPAQRLARLRAPDVEASPGARPLWVLLVRLEPAQGHVVLVLALPVVVGLAVDQARAQQGIEGRRLHVVDHLGGRVEGSLLGRCLPEDATRLGIRHAGPFGVARVDLGDLRVTLGSVAGIEVVAERLDVDLRRAQVVDQRLEMPVLKVGQALAGAAVVDRLGGVDVEVDRDLRSRGALDLLLEPADRQHAILQPHPCRIYRRRDPVQCAPDAPRQHARDATRRLRRAGRDALRQPLGGARKPGALGRDLLGMPAEVTCQGELRRITQEILPRLLLAEAVARAFALSCSQFAKAHGLPVEVLELDHIG